MCCKPYKNLISCTSRSYLAHLLLTMLTEENILEQGFLKCVPRQPVMPQRSHGLKSKHLSPVKKVFFF